MKNFALAIWPVMDANTLKVKLGSNLADFSRLDTKQVGSVVARKCRSVMVQWLDHAGM